MIDPSLEVASLITEAFKSAVRGVKKFDKWAGDKAVERDVLGQAARQYAARLEDRYNTMSVLGMAEPVPLRSIYVRVNVLEKIQERLHRSLEDLEEQFQRDTRRFGKIVETKAGIDVVSQTKRLMVLGKPGAGKTTFLKHLIFQALEGHLTGKCIPIFISLKDWSDGDADLLEYITNEFDLCNLPEPRPWVEHLLAKGKCLLLLDGLDEITKDADEAIRKIRDFSDKYDKNRFVISCRIAAYSYVFERFTDVEMADFDDEQIEAFIKNWFRDDEKTAALCWQRLCADPPTKELASVPLLLVLLCLAFDETLDFPNNRAELYQEAIDALLKKWDASRRIKRSEIYKNLTHRRKVDLLSHIAYRTFSEGQHFIPQRVIEQLIADYIVQLPEVTDVSLMPDSEAILRAIEAQHGLLIKRAKQVYSFSHLTVQEYFTARHIFATQGERSVEKLIEVYAGERTWSEVIKLTAGILTDATSLVKQLTARTRELVGGTKLSIRDGQAIWSAIQTLSSAQQQGRTEGAEYVRVKEGVVALRETWTSEDVRGKITLQITSGDHVSVIPMDGSDLKAYDRAVVAMHQLLACLQPHCYVAKDTREAIMARGLRDL